MTNYYGKYKDYLKIDKENTFQDGLLSNSKHQINDTFSQSFFTEKALIDGLEQDVILKQEKKSENKKVIFKPDTSINIGTVISINSVNYLTFDFLGDGVYSVYPTATVKLCNATFPIKFNKTKILLRDDNGNIIKDQFGRPVYKEGYEIEKDEPCIVETKVINSLSDSNQIQLPNGQIQITLKYQPSDTIQLNYVFNMFNDSFKIIDIDYTKVINNIGIVTIRAKREQEG